MTEPRMAHCGSEVGLYQFQFGEAPLTRCNTHTRGEKRPQCDGKVWERFLEFPLHNRLKDVTSCAFQFTGSFPHFYVSTKTMNLPQLAGDIVVHLCEMVDFHGNVTVVG